MNHLEKIAGCSRSVTDRKRCDGNKGPWKPKRPLETMRRDISEQAKRRPLFNQHHRQMLAPPFVTATGCLLRSFPITPEQRSPFYEMDEWSAAQAAKVSNIV
ncbi:hypothetical protein ACVWWO_007545 [Bradyrhizobium sp. F1.13.1]